MALRLVKRTPFIRFGGVFISSTIIAYGELITTKVSDQGYDLGVKDQGQIYMNLKSMLRPVMRTPLSFLDRMCSYLAQKLPVVGSPDHRYELGF